MQFAGVLSARARGSELRANVFFATPPLGRAMAEFFAGLGQRLDDLPELVEGSCFGSGRW